VYPQTGLYSLLGDGSTGYVSVSNQDESPTFSWFCWFQRLRNGLSSGADTLFMSVNDGGWGVGFQSDGTANSDKLFFSKIGVSGFLFNTPITDFDWHHVCVTFDTPNTLTSCYLDGVLDQTSAYAPTMNSSGGGYSLFGRGNSQWFNGSIAQHGIVSYVMNANQVAQLAAGRVDAHALELLGAGMLWLMLEGSGPTLNDFESSGNKGTLTGGITWTQNVPALLQLNFSQVNQNVTPQQLGMPWLRGAPVGEASSLSIAPPPPVAVMTGTPPLAAAAPQWLGMPWLRHPPVTDFSSLSQGVPKPPAPKPGPTTKLPFIPRYFPAGTQGTRQSRLQRHTDQQSVITNSLLSKLQIIQTGISDFELGYLPSTPTDWEGTAPTTLQETLDRLAKLLKSLNGGVGP
jgi:Concanavalin A-like lectin/glucanases superfamily